MQQAEDLTDIEGVVESLYTKNDAQYIQETQTKLQRIQRSDQGWQMAELLLKSTKPACQFFGALTYTVRMHSMTDDEAESLDKDQLLKVLLQWMVYHKQHNAPNFVQQKILSTLSVAFAKFPASWNKCVESMVASIRLGYAVLAAPPEASNVLENIAPQDLLSVLWFCNTLVEDLGNSGQSKLTNQQQAEINQHLLDNLPAVVLLLRQALDDSDNNKNNDDPTTLMTIEKGIDTLGTWIAYFKYSDIDVTELQPFSRYILIYLRFPPNEDIYSAVTKLVHDTYAYRPSFWPQGFKEEFLQLLLEQGDKISGDEQVDDQTFAFAEITLAFAELYMKSCVQRQDVQFSRLMDIIVKLTGLPGTPAVDDVSIGVNLLEFWTEYAEHLSELDEPAPPDQEQVILHVINLFWTKIQLPPHEEVRDWKSDSWDEFKSFRRDFCDFLELAYPAVRPALFNQLVSNLSNALSQAQIEVNWENVECCLHCINGLADVLGNEENADIHYIFDSPLLTRLAECRRERIHSTVVNMIGQYDEFFTTPRGEPHIPQALEYLFKSLDNLHLTVTASKSIYKLCDASRGFLTGLLPAFLSVHERMVTVEGLNHAAHERTVGAISCVIQAVGDLGEKSRLLDRLVSSLVARIEHELAVGTSEQSIPKVSSLVRCLVAVGKGQQVPDSEDVSEESEAHVVAREFWNRDEQGIRSKIVQVISVLAVDRAPYNTEVSILEACCDIFKQGFRETMPNPFVFPGELVVRFLQSKYNLGPANTLGVLTNTACCFLTSFSMPEDEIQKTQVVETLLDTFLVVSPNSSDDDPDVQTNRLKLLTQVMAHHKQILLSHPHLSAMIDFSIAMLASETKFVLNEASKFWVTLLQEPTLSTIYATNMNDATAKVTKVVVDKICGDAARSDLGAYVNVVRKMVFKFPQQTRQCFDAFVITHPVRALEHKDVKTRERFVARLFLTRGGTECSEVVKDFWRACRGLTYA